MRHSQDQLALIVLAGLALNNLSFVDVVSWSYAGPPFGLVITRAPDIVPLDSRAILFREVAWPRRLKELLGQHRILN